MDWFSFRIDAAHNGLLPVTTLLSSFGVDSVQVEDETEFRDFLEQNRACWDYVDEALEEEMRDRSRVIFYLPCEPASADTAEAIRFALADLHRRHGDYGELTLTASVVRDEDWENNWKRFYKPMEIGERLLVVPAWEDAPAAGRTVLRLNPGLTFGTGSHATTRLCLTFLEQQIRGGEAVLDLGCGSGILSLAALRLGAARAFACDIDEKCESVTRENAALNGIGRERFTVRIGDALSDEALLAAIGGGYDLLLANIVADVILALAPQCRRFLRPGGRFLCSGVIETLSDEVEEGLLANGWTILEKRRDEGWFAFLCQ